MDKNKTRICLHSKHTIAESVIVVQYYVDIMVYESYYNQLVFNTLIYCYVLLQYY